MANSAREDRCPGVVRLFWADDGGIGRLRFPAGRISASNWELLADLADTFGDGDLHLTSRANVQIRGIRPGGEADFADTAISAGIVPSPEHERVRNILGSPLDGIIGGSYNLSDLPERVDRALIAVPDTAALSGRFLIGLDSGAGDITEFKPDLGFELIAPDRGVVHIAGMRTELSASVSAAPSLLADLARETALHRKDHWRIADSEELTNRILNAAHRHSETQAVPQLPAPEVPSTTLDSPVPELGWLDVADGSVTLRATTQFGVIDSRLARFLAAIELPTTIDTRQRIAIRGLREEQAEQVVRVLAPLGAIFDADSPWFSVTACTGAPRCRKSKTDVRSDARTAIGKGALPVNGPQHWVGCERACGSRSGAAVVEATGNGYRVR